MTSHPGCHPSEPCLGLLCRLKLSNTRFASFLTQFIGSRPSLSTSRLPTKELLFLLQSTAMKSSSGVLTGHFLQCLWGARQAHCWNIRWPYDLWFRDDFTLSDWHLTWNVSPITLKILFGNTSLTKSISSALLQLLTHNHLQQTKMNTVTINS